MEHLKDRIELLISTKGMTNAVFAEKIGVQPSNISHVLSGRNKPSLDLVNKVLRNFKEVRTEWLVNGSGSMTKDYNLFDAEEDEILATNNSSNLSRKTEPEAEAEQIPKASESKIAENRSQKVDIKEDKPEIDATRELIKRCRPTRSHPRTQRAARPGQSPC